MACARVAAVVVALSLEAGAAAAGLAPIAGVRFESVMPQAPGVYSVTLAPYALARTPVTNAEFLAFVSRAPQWRRGAVPALFADARYLARWAGPLALGPGAAPDAPVTNVSWFAARAYCQAQGQRLPTWHEWEFAAAADEHRLDARADPAFRQRMLDWYSVRGGVAPGAVGRDAANLHGVHDLAAGVWEWVEDFNALMVSTDNREQGDPDLMRFCGAGALSMRDREAYAVLMRVAMLSALEARYTTDNLGFRCAR